MRLVPRTLSARLVAVAVALVALVSLLVTVAGVVVLHDYLTGQLDKETRGSLQRVANPRDGRPGGPSAPTGQQGDTRDDDADRLSFFGQRPETLIAVVADTSGTVSPTGLVLSDDAAAVNLSTATLRRLAAVPADGKGHTVSLTVGDYRVMATTDSEGRRVVVGLPTRSIGSTTGSLLTWSLLLTLLGVLLAAGAGTWLVRRQLRPLREVAGTAHQVTEQELTTGETTIGTRVPARNTDSSTEVGAVGAALNTLLDHVDAALTERHRSEQQVRQFVADASHELRTPLTTIHGYAQLSRRTPDDPTALALALDKVAVEAGRMSTLVEDLLLLARLDSGRPLEREEVDLTHLLLEAVADARVVAPDHRWRLRLPDEPVTVIGDEQRLHQVATNLLNNARRHTPPGTTITVAASPRSAGSAAFPGVPGAVAFSVHDDGPGLPEPIAAHAFERFTRGDSSRTRSSGGAGLGLSLVAAIASAHGGTAEVHSVPGDTTFTVTLT